MGIITYQMRRDNGSESRSAICHPAGGNSPAGRHLYHQPVCTLQRWGESRLGATGDRRVTSRTKNGQPAPDETHPSRLQGRCQHQCHPDLHLHRHHRRDRSRRYCRQNGANPAQGAIASFYISYVITRSAGLYRSNLLFFPVCYRYSCEGIRAWTLSGYRNA